MRERERDEPPPLMEVHSGIYLRLHAEALCIEYSLWQETYRPQGLFIFVVEDRQKGKIREVKNNNKTSTADSHKRCENRCMRLNFFFAYKTENRYGSSCAADGRTCPESMASIRNAGESQHFGVLKSSMRVVLMMRGDEFEKVQPRCAYN